MSQFEMLRSEVDEKQRLFVSRSVNIKREVKVHLLYFLDVAYQKVLD